MPIIEIIRLPEEQILVVVYGGDVTIDEVRAGAALVDAFHLELGGAHVYGVTDVRAIDPLSFAEIMNIMKEQRQGSPGTVTDPNYTMYFVGTAPMIDLYRNVMALPQNGGVQIPSFEEREVALKALRYRREQDIAERRYDRQAD